MNNLKAFCVQWQDMQLLRPLQKFQCKTEAFREETIFIMGLEFDFNQWWEAQLVSKPIENINAYVKGRQRECELRKYRNCFPIWYEDTVPLRIAPIGNFTQLIHHNRPPCFEGLFYRGISNLDLYLDLHFFEMLKTTCKLCVCFLFFCT